jgi:hypothetical protein
LGGSVWSQWKVDGKENELRFEIGNLFDSQRTSGPAIAFPGLGQFSTFDPTLQEHAMGEDL